MPFAVLSFGATDTLLLSKFVLSGPQPLKDWLEECLCLEHPAAVESLGESFEECYAMWNGNSCVLSKSYLVDVHELLNLIEQNGWKIDQFSTSLTGSGIQCQTYVFRQDA